MKYFRISDDDKIVFEHPLTHKTINGCIDKEKYVGHAYNLRFYLERNEIVFYPILKIEYCSNDDILKIFDICDKIGADIQHKHVFPYCRTREDVIRILKFLDNEYQKIERLGDRYVLDMDKLTDIDNDERITLRPSDDMLPVEMRPVRLQS